MLNTTEQIINDVKNSNRLKKIKQDGEQGMAKMKENAGKVSKNAGSIVVGILLNILKLVLFAPVMIFVEPIWSTIKGTKPTKRRFLNGK